MTQARTLNDRYELQSKIGDGGMAAVYKALDLKLNRVVAIKILRDSYAADPQFLARFKREAEQAASLNHPNIVRVFDVGDEGDVHYIVMEYVEGFSLKDIIIAEAPLAITRALEFGAQISDGIGYAHSTGLIHRDIKPQNILIDMAGRVKVTDFGIAKSATASTLTEAGITLGTVHYFSPEQAKGLPVMPQSDIYSIGVVLFEMLTGRIPFDSDNPVALALKHIEEMPPPLRRYNPGIPPVVEQIVLKALAKDPNQRFATSAQLSKALRNLEAQSEQGTMAVRPVPPAVNPTNYTGQVNRRSAVPPPGSYNYRDAHVQDPTSVNPVRPARPMVPPVPVPVAPPDNNYTYEQARRNGVRYYDERVSTSYRGRVPVEEVEYIDEVEQARGSGGCLPWIVGAAAFLMIVGLALAALLILPGLSTQTVRPTATVAATLAPSTTVAAEKVGVPAVLGKKQEDAENAIKAARLVVGDIKQENSDQPAGVVIGVNPNVGVKIDTGSKVGLTVSKGAETVPLTTYTNTPLAAARAQLEGLGFKVQVLDEFSDTIQPEAVTRTDPLGGPGVTVAKGSLIKLYVSKGKAPAPTTAPPATTAAPVATPAPPVPTTAPPAPTNPPLNPNQTTMPAVVKAKQADAERAIAESNLVFQVLSWNEADIRAQLAGAPQEVRDSALNNYRQVKKGDVFFTDPGEGTVLNKGTKVTIVVRKDN
jgi:serine/threonine protein kinase/beta-lactam-binding protein with PASTA domain